MGFLPQEDVGVVVLANGAGYSPLQFGAYALATAIGEDPDDLRFICTERLLKELSGSYQTYQGTMQASVKPAGSMLTLHLGDRLNPMTLILTPLDLDGEPAVFRFHAPDAKIDVEFHRKDGEITMLYERYAFRKTGSL
jgi:hypothetical protein